MNGFMDNVPIVNEKRGKQYHIPITDVDDLPFKNRQDPQFIANITNLMQVPSSITLSNGTPNNNHRNHHHVNNYFDNATFPMDVPEKLTVYADGILKSRHGTDSPPVSNDSMFEELKDNDMHDTTNTPPSTPTKVTFLEQNMENEFSKTPQIAADLFNRMRPRRSSIEVDLHAEIRILRDKINNLEHECQVNTRSCRVFYAVLFGYAFLKTFSWLVNK